jgi:uncharacterized protein YcbX
MAGEPLDRADVSWHGVAGDRRWAFIRDDLQRSGFPFLTIRARAELCHYRPRLLVPGRPDRSRVVVTTPGGAELGVMDPALAAELGDGTRAIKLDRGLFDAAPVSLITTRTIAGLEALLGGPLDVRRFRPNLVVEASGEEPWPEDAWVGRVLRIGELRLHVDRRDERCAVIGVDPDSAERDPRVLRAVAQSREGCAGVYGGAVRPGAVAVGDPVVLEDG